MGVTSSPHRECILEPTISSNKSIVTVSQVDVPYTETHLNFQCVTPTFVIRTSGESMEYSHPNPTPLLSCGYTYISVLYLFGWRYIAGVVS